MALTYIGILFILFLFAVPVAFSLAGTSILVTIMERGFDFNPGFLAQKAISGVDNFMLLAVPFFIYAGKVMNVGGITMRIYRFASALVGAMPGGLAQVNVVASIIFAGMTGTAVSEAAGLGTVVLKGMREAGYKEEFSVAVVAASSTIGPIIPPSVPMVIYALMSGVSVGGMLIAGLLPGILLGLALMVYIGLYARRNRLPCGETFELRKVAVSFRDGFFPLLTPVIIVGGIISGIFTPTEASAIAALYATILSMFIYKEVTCRDILEISKATAKDTGTIMLVVAMAMVYGYLVTRAGLTAALVESIGGISTNPHITGLLIVAFLLIIGCFLEATATILILSPVLVPIMMNVGIDPLHFGVVIVLTMMIGLLTPPFGMVLFVLARISTASLHQIVWAVIPFIIPLLLVDLVLVFIPEIVLVLPRLFL